MVLRKTHQGSSISKSITGVVLFFILLGIFVATVTMIVCLLLYGLSFDNSGSKAETSTNNNIVEIDDTTEQIETETFDLINFQPIVDSFVDETAGRKSVVIYDLENSDFVGEYNIEEDYNTASLYKLFVVYEGYRRIQNGIWNAEDIAPGTGQSILVCLDLAIRESNSNCAESLWSMIGHAELDEIIQNDYNIKRSNISTLTSNAKDILMIMKMFYDHTDITDENLIEIMKDSFLNQPITAYDWRQGLPSGFTHANVYNKVGWDYNPDGQYWNIYHDAAIVDFAEERRHYIIVVMTERIPFQKITSFGRMFEEAFDQYVLKN